MILGELIFVGLGLHDERDLSLRGLHEVRQTDAVFAEFYTSLMPALSLRRLEELVGEEVVVVSRQSLEEEEGEQILQEARRGKAAFLVPGDPLIATTHMALRLRAEKEGVRTRVIHGPSIISAAIGLSGLQNYKYGRSVTIPFPEDSYLPETPYKVIQENGRRGLHTLCFLDIKAEKKKYMTVKQGLNHLLEVEKKRKREQITPETLVVGIARAGSKYPTVKAGYIRDIIDHPFGGPPHTLVFPGRLHFMEAKALITLGGAPEKIRKKVQ